MKEVFKFIAWQWRKWEFWQKCFILTAPLMGASVTAPKPWDQYLAVLPMLVVFGFMCKWWIWDGVVRSWNSYKEDRNQLLTTIKNSDQ